MNMKRVLSEELIKISLSENELLVMNEVAKGFISSLKAKKIKAYIGGSLAKGTMINCLGKQDIDIFVVFDYSEDILGFEKILNKIKLPGKLKKIHGSRDYFQIICDDVILEVIPVVKNSDPEMAENITDVSLSHVKYISGEVKKNPPIADEIKLAKAFCQAQKFYGAESYIRGFSGYSLEVLVIYFGSFVKLIKGLVKLSGKGKVVIDPLKYYKNSCEVMRELNTSKLLGPLVLVDPTYKYRNVSAGLGFEVFEKFVQISKQFLKKPSIEYFVVKPLDIQELKKFAKSKNAKFVEVNLETDRQEGDIAGTKMKKFFDFVVSNLNRKEQKVLAKAFIYSGKGKKAKGYLVVLEKKEIEFKGPSISLDDASIAFRKAKGNRAFKRKKFWWYREKSSVKNVFNLVKKVGKEMGAWLEDI